MIKTLLFSLMCCLSFFQLVPITQDAEQESSRDEKLKEAVFRYQIRQCAPKNPATMYFLSDGGRDPSDKFMGLFKDLNRPVKKESEMGVSEATKEFIDKESGKPAVQLRIDRIKRPGGDEAEVEGSCGYATWAANGYKYRVVLESGKWVVKGEEDTWVL